MWSGSSLSPLRISTSPTFWRFLGAFAAHTILRTFQTLMTVSCRFESSRFILLINSSDGSHAAGNDNL